MEFDRFTLEQRSVLMAANAMDSTLLITGATGTGKSRLAHEMHLNNPRRSSAKFFKINLATLSENLIESELFGHERGSFTGADCRRVGRLEQCQGGTIFLDEIGDLPLRLQGKLLDFMQYKRISPVGSNREIDVDVRIIVATNRDLRKAVEVGEFREDLYHRMKVFHVNLPSIHDNKKTLICLAEAILLEISQRASRNNLFFSEEALNAIGNYTWPGNIRELLHAIEYAVAMSTTAEIKFSSLPSDVRDATADQHSELRETMAMIDAPISEEFEKISNTLDTLYTLKFDIDKNYYKTRDIFEKSYIERMLRLCGGRVNFTSRLIGLNKVTLIDKMKKHQIDWKVIRCGALPEHKQQHLF